MTSLHSHRQSAVKRKAKVMWWLLLASVIAVAVIISWNANIGIENQAGSGFSRPYSATAETSGSNSVKTIEKTNESDILVTPTVIDLRDGMLSVSLDGMPVQQLVAELTGLTGIEILFIGDHPDASVHMQFNDVPLEKALRLLLSEAGTIFVYADHDEENMSDRQLTRIFLLPEGDSGHINNAMNEVVQTSAAVSTQASAIDQLDQQTLSMNDRLTQQIQNSISQTQTGTELDPAINDIITEQALEELTEMLGAQIPGTGQAPVNP